MRACIAPSSASSLRLLLQTYRKPRSPARQFPVLPLRRPVPVRQGRAFRCCREDIPALYSELSDFLHDFIFCWLSTAQLVILNCPRSNRDFFCKSGLCQVGFHSLFSQPVFESHKAPLSKIFCEHEQTFANSIDVNIVFVLYCAYTNIPFVNMIPHEQSVCQHSWRNSCRKQATFLGTEDAYEQFTMQKSLRQSQSGCR